MPKLKSVAGAAAVLTTLALAPPVGAHPGSHHDLSVAELAAHFSSGWHLAALACVAAATAIAIAMMTLRSRREARARDRDGKPGRQS